MALVPIRYNVRSLFVRWSSTLLTVLAVGATIVSWNGIYLAEIPRQVPQSQVSAATSGTVMFSFAGIVFGPAAFSAIAAATGSYVPAFAFFNVAVVVSVIYLWRAR